MKTPATTYTTAINNLLIDYNKKIDILQNNINNKQKLIETDKAAISSFKEKINVLHEVLHELNELQGKTKDLSELKFNDLTPKGQCNAVATPIKPLTEEQIKQFNINTKHFETKNQSDLLNKALKKLEDINKNTNGSCSYFWDIQYSDDAKWPMDL
jgi:hypothetical protein